MASSGTLEVLNRDRGTVLGRRVKHASTWWRRARGLLGQAGLAEDEGLLLEPCRVVHMLGMRFPIDVAFLDADGRVVATYDTLAPGARTRYHRAATAALELRSGTLTRTGTVPGDRLTWSLPLAEESP